MSDLDKDLEVYKQSCEDHRFYGDMRFKQLTLWSVGIGFALNFLYGKEGQLLTVHQRGIWYVAAFFWTAVIWVMEVRSTVHGVRGMSSRNRFSADRDLPNKWTHLIATNSVAILYAASCLACAVQLARLWGPSTVTVWVVWLVLSILVAFTVREYWPLLKHAIQEGSF